MGTSEITSAGMQNTTFLWIIVIAFGAIWLGLHIIQAVGLQKLSSNRGEKGAWLAWLPIGSSYVLGRTADGIQRESERRAFFRISLPVLQLCLLVIAGILPFLQSAVTMISGGRPVMRIVSDIPVLAALMDVLWVILLLAAVTVQYISLYTVLREYAPFEANGNLVLSIIFPFLCAVFLFAIRDKRPYRELERQRLETELKERDAQKSPELIALERLKAEAAAKAETQGSAKTEQSPLADAIEKKAAEKRAERAGVDSSFLTVEDRGDGKNPFAPPGR